ncbi:ATP-binding protein [Collinsella tanakaei]|uniref:ATP-binding protein n=1 Tax=Collinsella tanakaei TaxID=626935 RepID=UPI0034E97173
MILSMRAARAAVTRGAMPIAQADAHNAPVWGGSVTGASILARRIVSISPPRPQQPAAPIARIATAARRRLRGAVMRARPAALPRAAPIGVPKHIRAATAIAACVPIALSPKVPSRYPQHAATAAFATKFFVTLEATHSPLGIERLSQAISAAVICTGHPLSASSALRARATRGAR